jgi:ABC-type transport system involved in multi-copper enzyme maturation permease subunit
MERIYAIALTTFRESLRSKILYSVLVFGVILVLVASLFGSVTIGDQVRVVKDFGLLSCSVFSIAFAVIAGAALVHKELSKKTVYNILAKPVHRVEFLLGKFAGMFATSCLLLFMMGSGIMAYAWLFDGQLDFRLLEACAYMSLELLIVCAAAIFFSTIVVTPLLAGLFTLGIFLSGRSTEFLLYFIQEKKISGLGADILTALYALLPHLDKLNVNNQVVYAISLPLEYFLWCVLYALSYAAVLLILAGIVFRSREFN